MPCVVFVGGCSSGGLAAPQLQGRAVTAITNEDNCDRPHKQFSSWALCATFSNSRNPGAHSEAQLDFTCAPQNLPKGRK